MMQKVICIQDIDNKQIKLKLTSKYFQMRVREIKKIAGSDKFDNKETGQGSILSGYNEQSVTSKELFNTFQKKIRQLFSIGKDELQKNYQSVIKIIKQIDISSPSQDDQYGSNFMDLLSRLVKQIDGKINSISNNIKEIFISKQSLVGFPLKRNSPRESIHNRIYAQKLQTSRRLIPMNQTFSSKSLKHDKTKVITSVGEILPENYNNVLNIILNNKRVQDMKWFENQWDILKTIVAQNKQIKQIAQFSKVKAPFLSRINFSSNQISDLRGLSQGFLPQLKVLNLKKNQILHLNGLEEANFGSLQILNLSYNKIIHLEILTQCYFPNLIELSLSGNKIESIECLSDCQFPTLQIINLEPDRNNIREMSILRQCYFPKLKFLSFSFNQIANIDFLASCSIRHLKGLHGQHNQIVSIDFLNECQFVDIEEIILNNNRIQSIKIISKLSFNLLKQLDLQNNRIGKDQILCFAMKSNDEKKAKQKYPFLQI